MPTEGLKQPFLPSDEAGAESSRGVGNSSFRSSSNNSVYLPAVASGSM